LQEYQVLVDESGPAGGRTYTFFAYIEAIEIGNENAGAVNFTSKLRVQGRAVRALVV
jgi:hypothetical protein